MNWKDLFARAGKTFLQAFVAIYAASQFGTIEAIADLALLETATVAGFAAVLAFVNNLFITTAD
jgi:p-aminobenzoyl-glutamate transporter AbgT